MLVSRSGLLQNLIGTATFNLVDDIVAGAAIPLALFAKTATLGFFYTGFYLLLAWTVFYRREL